MTPIDTSSDWPGYLILLMVAAIVGKDCVSALRGEWRKRKHMSLVEFVGCVGCMCVFCWMLFFQFKAVRIEDDAIRLIYAWPRPNKILHKEEIRVVTVERDRNRKGSIVVNSDAGRFRSRGFDRKFAAEELAQSIEHWKATP